MSDKTALVTGATGLLGRQVLKAFAKRDWTAKGTGYSRADGATILKVDLASAAEVEKALDTAKYACNMVRHPHLGDCLLTWFSGLE